MSNLVEYGIIKRLEVFCLFVKQSVSRGRIYLSFVQGYRDANGKVRHKTIEKLGYLDELKEIYDDPIAHFKAIAEERNRSEAVKKKIEVSLVQRLADNQESRKNLGYAVPKRIYSMLGIRDFFQSKQNQIKAEFSLNSVFSLLVFHRFLFPASKKKAHEDRHMFFESYDFSLDDVYHALDYFARYSEQLQEHLHQEVCRIIGRNGRLAYYDVTNYYFEIPYNDEDKYDDKGNLIKKGFRKRGPSKEHRPDPIVQMGLLTDTNGIPMAFNVFSGGESEKTSLRPVIRRVKRDYDIERIVVVADRGLNTSDNTAFLSGTNDDDSRGHDGYVYGQSVLGADKDFKAWVLDPEGYIESTKVDDDGKEVTFRHKSRIYAKTVQLKDSEGKRTLKTTIYQKQLVYHSQKYANKQKRERELLITKAKDLIAHPGKYTRATSVGAAGYVRNIRFIKETGEIPNGLDLFLDLDRIAEEEQYDGYYAIVTSEKHLSDQQIHDIYRGLWEIEESFKIIKSEFKARPVYVRTEEHIQAHFLICFVALLILRILEHKLAGKYPAHQIRESLLKYSCSYLEQNYYLFDYRDEILRAVEEIFDMDLANKILSLSEIKKILQYQD